MRMLLAVAVAGLFLVGCRGLYEGFRSARVEDCYRLPYPDQDACLQQIDVSYEVYEHERKAVGRSQ